MEEHLLNRFSELFNKRGERFAIVNDTMFIPYNKMILPFAPVNGNISILEHQAKELCNELGGVLVRWSDSCKNSDVSKEWYAVTCNSFSPVESVKSKLRNEIQKGLSNFTITRIDAHYLSLNGYYIYNKVNSSYKNFNSYTFDQKAFYKYILPADNFDDIIHYWGIFCNGKMIGFSSNYIFDSVEALYASIKIIPEYLGEFASYALIYKMNQYYLAEKEFSYVNDGYRSLLHETNIQNFLIKKFNFTKTYLHLNLYYSPIINVIVKFIYPARGIFSRLDNRLNAILELERIRRSCNE
jgi:hypothetical protein